MNATETKLLLLEAAKADLRIKVTADLVEGWHGHMRGLAYAEALTALHAHQAASTDWLMPAHIVSRATDARRRVTGRTFDPAGDDWRLCPWPSCRCTHTAPCEAGWIDDAEGKAAPCPTCRPELAQHFNFEGYTYAARQGLRALPRPSRGKQR